MTLDLVLHLDRSASDADLEQAINAYVKLVHALGDPAPTVYVAPPMLPRIRAVLPNASLTTLPLNIDPAARPIARVLIPVQPNTDATQAH